VLQLSNHRKVHTAMALNYGRKSGMGEHCWPKERASPGRIIWWWRCGGGGRGGPRWQAARVSPCHPREDGAGDEFVFGVSVFLSCCQQVGGKKASCRTFSPSYTYKVQYLHTLRKEILDRLTSRSHAWKLLE
jgi:hypothetical protein